MNTKSSKQIEELMEKMSEMDFDGTLDVLDMVNFIEVILNP